jgi:hypothetical protein
MSCFDLSCVSFRELEIAPAAAAGMDALYLGIWLGSYMLPAGGNGIGLRIMAIKRHLFRIGGSKSLRVWRNTLKRLCPPNRFSLGSTHGSIGSRLRAHIPRVLYIALSLFWLGWFPDTTALDKHQQAPLPAKVGPGSPECGDITTYEYSGTRASLTRRL